MSTEPSRRLTHMEAIIEAIAEAMREDSRVFYIGQDVGAMGGSMQGTKGLTEEFGPMRIREAPISESAMVGAGDRFASRRQAANKNDVGRFDIAVEQTVPMKMAKRQTDL